MCCSFHSHSSWRTLHYMPYVYTHGLCNANRKVVNIYVLFLMALHPGRAGLNQGPGILLTVFDWTCADSQVISHALPACYMEINCNHLRTWLLQVSLLVAGCVIALFNVFMILLVLLNSNGLPSKWDGEGWGGASGEICWIVEWAK